MVTFAHLHGNRRICHHLLSVPSPIGHALAGAAVALAAERLAPAGRARPSPTRLILLCAFLATAADLDLLSRYIGLGYSHRTVTHSVTMVASVMIVTAVVTGWVTGRITWFLVALFGVAYGSHLLLDFYGDDPVAPHGIQMFWPFREDWLVAEPTLFLNTQRREPLSATTMATNARAVIRELLVMVPVVLALYWVSPRRQRAEGRRG